MPAGNATSPGPDAVSLMRGSHKLHVRSSAAAAGLCKYHGEGSSLLGGGKQGAKAEGSLAVLSAHTRSTKVMDAVGSHTRWVNISLRLWMVRGYT